MVKWTSVSLKIYLGNVINFDHCRLKRENLPKKLSKPYIHCDSKYKTRDFFDDNFGNNNKKIKYL